MASDTILQVSDLGKRYGTRWAVKGLDLTVRRAEVFGFLGPNGAGKSTTIRMLLSLVNPTKGTIELFGKALARHRAEVLARVGGLVERADFYLYLSARRNLEIVAALRGGVPAGHIDRVLDTVGLLARGGDKVKTFSHGMKQRLGIGQALLGDPEFVILDEPTSGLDPQGIKEVRDLVRRLTTERGITVFLSSHLLGEIEQTATSMAIINRGTLVIQGSVEELLSGRDALVRIDARPADRAVEILTPLPFITGITREGNVLDVNMPSDKAAEANAVLVRAGIEVRSLVPRRSLEEYFLSITQGASETA